MRITTGSKKGHIIKVPKGAVRPTKDMVRQAIFNILGQDLSGLIVADLFAGSGSLGLEALSRGAIHCDFVEIDHHAHQTLSENVTRLNLWGNTEIYEMDTLDFVSNVAQIATYDAVFADPPYSYDRTSRFLHKVTPILKPEGLLVLEHDSKTKVKLNTSSDLELNDTRIYGATAVSFFRKRDQQLSES